jgi:hypothetical protein
MGKIRNILRAILLPLILLFGIIGVILMLYGTIEMFTLPPKGAKAAGGSNFLVDCDALADTAPNDNVKAQIKARCDAQQRPFLFLLCLAAVMTLLAVFLALCLAIKSPRWVLNFLSVHNAVTIALLFMSIFAMMSVLALALPLGQAQESKTQANEESVHLMAEEKPARNDPYSKQLKYITDTVQPCFWIGVAFNLIACGLILCLTSGMWHTKGRARDDTTDRSRDYEMGYGRRPTIGATGHHAEHHTGHHTGSSTGRQEPMYYTEADRGRSSHHGAAPVV